MNNLNSVLVEGVIAFDLDLKETKTGKSAMTIVVTTHRSYKVGEEKRDEYSNVSVVLYGSNADNAGKYLVKGQMVRITGFLSEQKWEKDGARFSKLVVVCDNIEYGAKPKAKAPAKEYPETLDAPAE